MKKIVAGLIVVGLLIGGLSLPAEAGGWRHRHHGGFHVYGHGHHFDGFIIGLGAGILLDRLLTPPVYYPPVVCRDVWFPGHWEIYPGYRVWVEGRWERRCH